MRRFLSGRATRKTGATLVLVWLSFLAGTFGISFAAIFVRLALPAAPVTTGFYRMLFASALLAVGLTLRRWLAPTRPAPEIPLRSLLVAVAAGACFGTDLALWHNAIVATSVANATLLVNTTPVYVGLYSWLILRQRLQLSFLWGSCLALAGGALLLGAERSSTAALRGDGLALAAALFYSAYLLLMKNARRHLDAAPAVLLASLSATGVLGLYALALGSPFSGFPAHSWGAMLGAALISQIGGVLAIAWALRFLRATFASVALLAQPVGTALLGWLLLAESLSIAQAIGGAAVLAGIFAASRGGMDPDRTPHPGNASARTG